MSYNFKKYYLPALDQFKESWQRILVWTSVWAILYYAIISWMTSGLQHEIALSSLGVSDSNVVIIILMSLGILIFQLFGFSIVSNNLMGVVYHTDYDPEANWLSCGNEGTVHPIRSLASTLVVLVGSGLFFTIAAFVSALSGAGQTIVSAIFFILGCIIFLNMMFVWFITFDYTYEESRTFPQIMKQIGVSLKFTRGRRGEFIVIMLPVLAAMTVSFALFSYSSAQINFPDKISYEMAKAGYERYIETKDATDKEILKGDRVAQNEKEKQVLKTALEKNLFNKPYPTYKGDYGLFVSQASKYGFDREKFEAKKENREQSQIAQLYDSYGLAAGLGAGSRWYMLGGISGILLLICLGFTNTVLVQYYRHCEDPDEEPEPKEVPSTTSNADTANAEGQTAQAPAAVAVAAAAPAKPAPVRPQPPARTQPEPPKPAEPENKMPTRPPRLAPARTSNYEDSFSAAGNNRRADFIEMDADNASFHIPTVDEAQKSLSQNLNLLMAQANANEASKETPSMARKLATSSFAQPANTRPASVESSINLSLSNVKDEYIPPQKRHVAASGSVSIPIMDLGDLSEVPMSKKRQNKMTLSDPNIEPTTNSIDSLLTDDDDWGD